MSASNTRPIGKKKLKKKNNINQLWALSKWASCKHHHTEQSIWVCAAISRAAQNWKWNSNDWRGSNRSSCVACVLYLVGLRVDLRDGSEHYGRLLASAREHTVYVIWYAISRWAFIVFFLFFSFSNTHICSCIAVENIVIGLNANDRRR